MINYFIEEFTETFDYIDELYPDTPLPASTLLLASVAAFTTLVYNIHEDWSPYRGYMKGYLHKKWYCYLDCMEDREMTYHTNWDHTHQIDEAIATELLWTKFRTQHEYFYLGKLPFYFKSLHSHMPYYRWEDRDQPWWWDLFHYYIMYPLMGEGFYRRYEWLMYRPVYYYWWYQFPFLSKSLNYKLVLSDVWNPVFQGRWIKDSEWFKTAEWLKYVNWFKGWCLVYHVHLLHYVKNMKKVNTLLQNFNLQGNRNSRLPLVTKNREIYTPIRKMKFRLSRKYY